MEIVGAKSAKIRLKSRAKCVILRLRLIPRLCGAVDLVEFRLIEEVPPSVLLRKSSAYVSYDNAV